MRQHQTFAIIPGWLLIITTLFIGVSASIFFLFAARVSAFEEINASEASNIQSVSTNYLGDADYIDAPYGITPTIDGKINPGEYAGAGKLIFPGYEGDIEAYVRQNASYLYIAIDSPDKTPYPYASGGGTGPALQIFLDTNNDKATLPQTDDFRLTLQKNGGTNENQGDGSSWGNPGTGNWNAAAYPTPWGWQAEFSIALSKLGISSPSTQTIGISVAEVWTPSWPKDWYWPLNANWLLPSSWGNLSSSSYWDTFYWKPGPYEDYAPSGVPDFDQSQVGLTYCGPFAMANSLWWFDSKLEEDPEGPSSGGPPAILPISDSYTLVEPYGNWDDHDPQNVISLTQDLGLNYLGTDQSSLGPGTNVYSMYYGIQNYFRDHGLWDDYAVTLINKPDFPWIAEEVMRSEDVVLLLGFWQEQPPGSGYWVRLSGHYVTVAGVDIKNQLIALSDPAQDAKENGGVGRILNGTLVSHSPIPGHPSNIHNDAGNVSHDIYSVLAASPSPGGIWYLPGYEAPMEFLIAPPNTNPNPKIINPPGPYIPGFPVNVEIEYALAVSPYDWKASGKWVEDDTVALYNRKFVPYDDFAPSGVPDFDQKQDSWGKLIPAVWHWTFCGPTAAANSLWWFDSKFELFGATPPTISDTYPLLSPPYGAWDDHNPLNVDNAVTVWPPGGELIENLAIIFDTDGSRTHLIHHGTTITDIYTGLSQYISNHNLQQGYVITQVEKPEYWWVAEETERSEDVILLLGFYADLGGGYFERAGGHYVTVAGVDKVGGYVAFSDPYWDRMETILPPNEFSLSPLWSGRVAKDGDPPLGSTGLVPTYTHNFSHTNPILHNDAANISHDLYSIKQTLSPGGVWGPKNYAAVASVIKNFAQLNGVGTNFPDATPIETEVEWALAVSPVSDLWITKTITPTDVTPGDWVTITLRFGNNGNLAEDTVVSDSLPVELINASIVGAWNDYGATITPHGQYTFTVGDIPIGMSGSKLGIITITAQINPNISWPETSVITNTASITSSTQEQYQIQTAPNTDSVSVTVQTSELSISKVTTIDKIASGEHITYTIFYTNSGPGIASNAVITDNIPTEITNTVYSYLNNYGASIAHLGQYVWLLDDIPPNGNGAITLTGVANFTSADDTITNTASIDSLSNGQDPINTTDPVVIPVYYRYFLPFHGR